MNDKCSYKRCDKCGEFYEVSPFHNMLANGELAYSQIELYGDKFCLCPKCTNEIYRLIRSKRFSTKKI